MRSLKKWFPPLGKTDDRFIRREKWTRDILRLMLIIQCAAVPILLILTIFKVLDFNNTLVIYILIALTIPFWLISRTSHWRWARYFPSFLCFGLGIYASSSYLAPLSPLFYAFAVFLSGMLMNVLMQRIMVILAILAYAYTTLVFHATTLVNDLGAIITSLFLFVSIATLQEYYYNQVNQLVTRQNDINQTLSEEISRRKELENTLVESEAQLRRLAEYTTDLVAEISPEGIFRYASPSYEATLGYDPQNLIGTNALDMVYPDDLSYVLRIISEAAEDKQPHTVQLRCFHANGSIIFFETSGAPLFNQNDELEAFIISSRDISHLHVSEARRIASEQVQENVISFIPLGIHMYKLLDDGNLIFTGYNPAADKILGIKHAALVGKRIEDAFPNLESTDIPDHYRETARYGIPWVNNQVIYTDDKIIGSYDVHAFRTTDMDIMVLFSDVTEKHHTSVALKASEEKFSKAFHTSPDSVNINRLKDGLYIDINEGFTKLTGYDRLDVIGKSSLELNIWADPADRDRLVMGLREKGYVDNLQAQFRYKDGSVRTGLMSARVIEINSEMCILSITRDISDRIEAEEQLILAHENLENAYADTLEGWVHALDLREHETADHSRRVVELTMRMLDFYNFNDTQRKDIYRGALLHDIGKIGVPDEILLKPGPLTDAEWEIMRKHPIYSREMIANIPYLTASLDIPYFHHEWWDGSGYPSRIAGDEIPLPARIFAVVDVYDALLSDRPYRKAWPEGEVIKYLNEQRNSHFDSRVIDNFLKLL